MADPLSLRYGIVSTTATYWNLYVADRLGFYAAESLDVRPAVTGGTARTIEGLVDGQVDLAGCSPDELITAVQRGHDLVVIGGIVGRPVSWIVGRPGLADVGALRGRRVGVNQTRGSVSIVLRAALQDAGLAPGDYEQVAIGATPAMAEALREGRVDAAMLTAPFDLALIREGFSALLNVGERFPRYAFTTVNARRAWVQEHEDTLASFFRATRAAGAVIADPSRRSHSEEALGHWTGLAAGALAETFEVYRQPGVLSRRGELDAAALEAVLSQMAEQRLLQAPVPDVSELLLPMWTD